MNKNSKNQNAYIAPQVDYTITEAEAGFCSSVENFHKDAEYPWNE